MILHAGDLVTLDVITQLEAQAPVYAVYGNVDPLDVVQKLPKKREIEVEGVRIGLIHGDGPAGRRPSGLLPRSPASTASSLATPIRRCAAGDDVLLFNPGSRDDRRAQPKHSVGILPSTAGR